MHGMMSKYFLLPDSQQEEYTQEETPWQEELTLSQWACEVATQEDDHQLKNWLSVFTSSQASVALSTVPVQVFFWRKKHNKKILFG
jgi:hypothetical protein